MGRMRTGKEARTQAVTVRMPVEIHEGLRVLCQATGQSMNEVMLRALGNYLSDEGHRKAVEGFLERAQDRYQVALEKLANL